MCGLLCLCGGVFGIWRVALWCGYGYGRIAWVWFSVRYGVDIEVDVGVVVWCGVVWCGYA